MFTGSGRTGRAGGEYIGDDKLLATALRERGVIIKRRSRPRNFFCAGLRIVKVADEQRRAEAEAKAARERQKLRETTPQRPNTKQSARGRRSSRPRISKPKDARDGRSSSTKISRTGKCFRLFCSACCAFGCSFLYGDCATSSCASILKR